MILFVLSKFLTLCLVKSTCLYIGFVVVMC